MTLAQIYWLSCFVDSELSSLLFDIDSLNPAAIPQELQTDALLTLEQLTTSITVLALHAFQCPEETPRIRLVFEHLLEVIQAETEMKVYDLP